jgi:queuosine precursor transporter
MLTKDKLDARRRREGIAFLVLFALTIPAANWLIGNAGTTCVPNGPCLIPVAPGLMAPSGVTMIGIALVLRDLVQRRLGLGIAVAAILVGAVLSALVAPPALVVASAAAFLLSELADFAVYTPLARRRLVAAVVASSLVGLVVDSIVFLWLAFGSLDFLAGQVVGKAWMVLLSIPFVAWLRRRDERTGIEPA